MEKTALIAMSGGVDSSVAAFLLLERGYRVEGATMRLYTNEDLGLSPFRTCCSQRDIDDAAEVAFRLDIPYRVIDYTRQFREKIIEKFISVYEAGGTPNPCIDCNRFMKFGLLMDAARAAGLNYIVTGHYARIEEGENGRLLLKKAADPSKDQSYVLYSMTQEELRHTLFPLGGLTKAEVREIAERQGFVNARKRDSQDICFVPDGDYVKFIEQWTGKKYAPGSFISSEGEVLGVHRGAVGYTLGQRRGLGLPMGERVFVTGKDMEKNTVTVGSQEALYARELIAGDVNLIPFDTFDTPMRVTAKTRYRQKAEPATLYPPESGRIRLVFDSPQRAMTPGQAGVFYDGDTVVGGGTIEEVRK